jgi:hypothetical protein
MIVVINCSTAGVAEYGLDWIDVIEHGGEVYGLTATGVETLANDGTGVVDGRVKTGDLDFGSLVDKQVPRWYGAVLLTAAATLTVVASRLGRVVPIPYALPVRTTDGVADQMQRKERLARGPRGVWWSFEVRGSAFVLGACEVLAAALSRKG